MSHECFALCVYADEIFYCLFTVFHGICEVIRFDRGVRDVYK